MNGSNMHRVAQGSQAAIVLGAALFVVLGSGCGTTRPADFTLTGFDFGTVDDVTVLPVVDHRIDQSKQLKLDAWVLKLTSQNLEWRGYSCTIERDRSLVSGISREEIEAPTRDFIESLPPAPARWVLVLVLEDSSSKMTFGSTGNAEMAGYLFDKTTGQLIWRNKELSRMGQGGLVGMAMKGGMEKSAIKGAVNQMFETFPKRPR